jgi:hypothetical protein
MLILLVSAQVDDVDGVSLYTAACRLCTGLLQHIGGFAGR